MDVKSKLIDIIYCLISFVLIIGSLTAGNAIQQFLDTSIPGSIFGMLLLFAAMASGLLPSKWVKSGANIIIRFMVLLFVPISVGLMEHIDMLINNALPILASAVGGSLIVLVSLALFLDHLLTRRD
ncbi:CidA/LrgA family protein [Vibrio gallaecicus]|uniref:CidA/LrgA family protein n=1 Tax=Vibrio gallaecicus TaxID=552386 RepID=UPI0010C96D1A|nr:CidA/LrgA family protein [Vibrio gallaecicus]MDN3613845.1 CidA/LrgA family protein [Vibrio gallaecicus]